MTALGAVNLAQDSRIGQFTKVCHCLSDDQENPTAMALAMICDYYLVGLFFG